jgi:glutamate synthase (NADPH/NADH) large chain
MQAFGYTTETLQFMLRRWSRRSAIPSARWATTPRSPALGQPRLVYDYFKQLFAQVTNPPIDSIREEVIMSLNATSGRKRNLLGETPEHAHRLHLEQPILSNEELAALSHINHRGWKAKSIDITWQRQKGAAGLYERLREIWKRPETAVDQGYSILVLSDRGITKDDVAISALLAVGAVHQHLSKQEKRTRVGIAIETGEAREVHHHCLLLGYGADAINPYLAFEALWQELRDGRLSSESFSERRLPREGVPEGVQQGHPQGDGQDGHLDAAVLQGRADLRGRRSEPRSRGSAASPAPRAASKVSASRCSPKKRCVVTTSASRRAPTRRVCRSCRTTVRCIGARTARSTCGIRARSS